MRHKNQSNGLFNPYLVHKRLQNKHSPFWWNSGIIIIGDFFICIWFYWKGGQVFTGERLDLKPAWKLLSENVVFDNFNLMWSDSETKARGVDNSNSYVPSEVSTSCCWVTSEMAPLIPQTMDTTGCTRYGPLIRRQILSIGVSNQVNH